MLWEAELLIKEFMFMRGGKKSLPKYGHDDDIPTGWRDCKERN